MFEDFELFIKFTCSHRHTLCSVSLVPVIANYTVTLYNTVNESKVLDISVLVGLQYSYSALSPRNSTEMRFLFVFSWKWT